MSTIAANTYRLPIVNKLAKGQQIINLSTDNPNVPGNEATVARLVAAQAVLDAAYAAYESIHQQARQLLAERDTAVQEWNTAINGLAVLTESITDSNPEKILSTGFDVRSPKTPPQTVAQITEVRVRYEGNPGYSNISWKSDRNAAAYRVQRSPDPITDTSWTEAAITIAAKFRGNGATPGERCWYRVAAINRLGQGPWSAPALRPAM